MVQLFLFEHAASAIASVRPAGVARAMQASSQLESEQASMQSNSARQLSGVVSSTVQPARAREARAVHNRGRARIVWAISRRYTTDPEGTNS